MFWRFLFSESDPPHKIMWYWLNYSIYLVFSFHTDLSVILIWFVPQLCQFRRGISGGPALKCFYMIHRGRRIDRGRSWIVKVLFGVIYKNLNICDRDFTFQKSRLRGSIQKLCDGGLVFPCWRQVTFAALRQYVRRMAKRRGWQAIGLKIMGLVLTDPTCQWVFLLLLAAGPSATTTKYHSNESKRASSGRPDLPVTVLLLPAARDRIP